MRYTISFWFVGFLMILFLSPAFAQDRATDAVFDDFPDTIAGKRGEEFIDAFNSGSAAKMKKYLQAHLAPSQLKNQPLSQLVSAFASIRQQTGELEVLTVQEESEFSVVIKTKMKSGGSWIDIAFSVEKNDPHYQVNLGITPGRAPTAIDYTEWNNLPELLSLIREQTGAPSVAIAIIKNGKIHKSAVSGVRDTGDPAKAELSDRYHIGSVGKSMTAVLIGKLIEQKKINWNTTIGEILNDVEMRDDYQPVTVLQLLNHRGGIAPFVDDRQFDREKFIDDKLSPQQQRMALAKAALGRKPVGPIGETMTYSNAGYVILGAMAERIVGKPFEQLITELVFKPLEFEAAGFGWPQDNGRSNQPAGHVGTANKIRVIKPEDARMGHFLTPAGDMHFSITDLARYAVFHLDGINGKPVMLNTEIIQQLHQPPETHNYAAGWVIQKAPDGSPLHFHNGSLVSFYAAIFLYPQHNAAVVVVTNMGMNIEPEILRAVKSVFEKEIR